ncbi:uncharacterized protein LOC127736229 [Mytilus californianus]|uniref:uncharacterized protein LOC127736229 n=1 Tax=Mytilus californianus TaxID=6549 RepID=UPI002247B821|nr:uncharacterized protein LOC127736229 [Mytilus californianus]
MASSTSLQAHKYKYGFQRSRGNKFKWYLILAISIVFVVLAVTVIALTIYLTSENNKTGDKDAQYDPEDEDTEQTVSRASATTDVSQTTKYQLTTQKTTAQITMSSTESPTTIKITSSTQKTTPGVFTSHWSTTLISTQHPITKPPTQLQTTEPQNQQPTTEPTSTTQKSTTVNKPLSTEQQTNDKSNFSTPQSTTQLISSTQKATMSTQQITTEKMTSSSPQTTLQQTSDESSTAQYSTSNDPAESTSVSTTSTAQATSTSSVDTTTIELSGYNISSSSPFLLTCEVKNIPGWIDLLIYRHYGNNQSGLLAQMTAGAIVPTVIVVDDSLTFSANHHSDAITMVLMAQNFECNHAGTYSCSVSSANVVVSDETDIKVVSEPPEIYFPVGVVEDRTMSLDCVVEFEGTSGDIKWTFSPPLLGNMFYDLSIVPDTKNSSMSCTTKLESKLTFTPGMYDNGSNFRCEVVNADGYNGATVLQTTVPFYVLHNSICTNRMFEIFNHPYQPCGKIIYCSENGILVFEIPCPLPGYCYDALLTDCVLEKDLSIYNETSSTTIGPSTTVAPPIS